MADVVALPREPLSTERVAFVCAVAARVEPDALQYEDRSFTRPPMELVDEITEELLGVAGWAFILWPLWPRLREIRERVEGP